MDTLTGGRLAQIAAILDPETRITAACDFALTAAALDDDVRAFRARLAAALVSAGEPRTEIARKYGITLKRLMGMLPDTPPRNGAELVGTTLDGPGVIALARAYDTWLQTLDPGFTRRMLSQTLDGDVDAVATIVTERRAAFCRAADVTIDATAGMHQAAQARQIATTTAAAYERNLTRSLRKQIAAVDAMTPAARFDAAIELSSARYRAQRRRDHAVMRLWMTLGIHGRMTWGEIEALARITPRVRAGIDERLGRDLDALDDVGNAEAALLISAAQITAWTDDLVAQAWDAAARAAAAYVEAGEGAELRDVLQGIAAKTDVRAVAAESAEFVREMKDRGLEAKHARVIAAYEMYQQYQPYLTYNDLCPAVTGITWARLLQERPMIGDLPFNPHAERDVRLARARVDVFDALWREGREVRDAAMRRLFHVEEILQAEIGRLTGMERSHVSQVIVPVPEVRRWAAERGMSVPESGPLPRDVVEGYKAAVGEELRGAHSAA